MTIPTVAVAVHDGYYGCGTGAGYANYGFLSTLTSVLPSNVRLAVLPVRLTPDSPEHHRAWHRRARKLLRRAIVLPVDNGTAGQDRWGSLDNFRVLVRSTSDRLRELHRSAGPLLILAFDAPFLGLGTALPPDLLPDLVLVPRSSAKIHAPRDTERIGWERDGLLAAATGGARIAAISPFLAEHLRNEYHVPHESLATLHDGLVPDDWARLRRATAANLPPFVLAMGRAEPYKGFEDLLDAWEILSRGDSALPRLILAATSEQREPTPYQRKLRRIADRLGTPISLPTRFTPEIARLLGHQNLRAVVVPSRAEPFRRIPMEAFATGAGPVITTTQHGLDGQVVDGSTGFVSDAGSPPTLAAALHRALCLSSDQRVAMRNRALQVALRDYDHPAAVRVFLAAQAPWLALPSPDDRLRWLNAAPPTPRSPVSTVPPVKVPIGRQAPHWTTIQAERRVLVVVHHVTSLLRLLDVLPVFGSDTRIQIVFTWNGSDPFRHGLQAHLDRLGAAVIPWAQAIETEFDLVLAANHGGLTEITDPLVVLPHGAGYTKNSPGNRKPETGNRKPETGNRKPETGNRTVFGLSPEWLLYDGRPIATAQVLAHEEELERLVRLTPSAADTAVVAGDPAYDRMLRSRHLRGRYREALGIAPDQKLVTVTSTWWRNSLLGSWPSLFREILGSLDRDRYRVAGLLHPNIWHGHGPWQLHTWLADCLRAGLLLPPPAEGWQAVLLASDVIVGDHGATTVYGSCLDLPVLLATFPDHDVAPGSVGELLGRSAERLNRHEPLGVQIERAHQKYQSGSLDDVAALVTSCPGESAARLRRLFYNLLQLPEPADGPVVPVLPAEAVASPPPPAEHANLVVCQPGEPGRFDLRRYPADVSLDRSGSAAFADAILTAHEHHPDDALRRRAAIVLSRAGDQNALTDVLRRHPQATLAAGPAAKGSLLLTKSGRLVESTFADPEIAAAVLFEHLLRDAVPHQATVSCGGKALSGQYESISQVGA